MGATIVAAIMNMAKSLDVDVIAEGIETVEQANILRRLGCPFAQGYLYAPPAAADAIPALLERTVPALSMAASPSRLPALLGPAR